MIYIDPVEVSGDNYKLLLKNDAVKVLEMTLKAGTSDIEHSHHIFHHRWQGEGPYS